VNAPLPVHAKETYRSPSGVREIALRLGADPNHAPAAVRLEQSGRLRAVGSKRWMAFTATQTISNQHCAFDWRARAGFARALSARDALSVDGGLFELGLFGVIPLRRAPGSLELLKGQSMRYLAELAWAPDALLHNADVRWREAGRDAFDVSISPCTKLTRAVLPHDDASAAQVRLTFDEQGRFVEAFASDRPRSVQAHFEPTPWRARFFDYRRHCGRWLPFAGAVAWLIDGREEVYWEGRIERWELVEAGASQRAERPIERHVETKTNRPSAGR